MQLLKGFITVPILLYNGNRFIRIRKILRSNPIDFSSLDSLEKPATALFISSI